MKKSITIVMALLAIALAGVGTYQFVGGRENTRPNTNQTKIQTSSKISFSKDKKSVRYDGVNNVTALATLKSLTRVDTKNSDYGEMVVGINGLRAGNDQYWAFYVNDALSNEGAGTYKASPSDKIEWRLEEF